MKFVSIAILVLFLVACSSISLKKVEIRKQNGSILKIESLEAYNVSELELLRVLSSE